MIETYKGYYGDRVNENTIVKIIRFSFFCNSREGGGKNIY
jgi:hypothetical protein